MPLRLIIEDDEGATTIVPLGKEAITIGRQQGNTIQLTEKNVSRTHARLFPESEAWMIEDLNSYNGIKVNDKPVDGRMKLREGDIVQIGDYHLAITEDVDKRTLNYDRAGVVANDGDPLLASSSADLPRLSQDEIHALSSGPQQITPAPSPMMVDSGPVPATPYAAGYGEPKKKGSGLLIALGLLVLGGGAIAAFMLQRGDDQTTDSASASAGKANDGAKAAPAKAAPPAKAVAPPTPTPPAADGATPDPVPEPATPTPSPDPVPTPPPEATPDPVPTPPPVDDDPVVIDDEPPKPTPQNTTTKKKKKPPKPTPPKPTPQPPKDTGPSADELYDKARKMSFKDPAGAYKLAKQSYGKKASSKAATLMGTTACRMGDKSKAKYAYSRVRGAAKEDMKKACAQRGVNL